YLFWLYIDCYFLERLYLFFLSCRTPISTLFPYTTLFRSQSTFATLRSNFWAEGLAFDSSGSLFVAAGDTNDPNLGSTIFKFTPDGTQSTFGSVPSVIIGLAFDSAGNLCVPDFGGVCSNPSGSLRPTAQKATS